MKKKYDFEKFDLKLTFTDKFWKEVSLLNKKNKEALFEALVETQENIQMLLYVMSWDTQYCKTKKRKVKK